MRTTVITGLLIATSGALAWAQQDDARSDRPDVGKMMVERPLIKRIADAGKSEAELPIKEKLATPAAASPSLTGRVAWRASLEAALEKAKETGKPVLVFQLLGKLDDEWC